MEKPMRGSVVLVLNGHDSGRYQVVLRTEENGWAFLADGKLRTLEKPKRKNKLHFKATDVVLEEELLRTDKQLRKALHPFNYGKEANAAIEGGIFFVEGRRH